MFLRILLDHVRMQLRYAIVLEALFYFVLNVLNSLLLTFHYLCFTGTLKGVMRVGCLAKGLLLHGSLDVELVVLCNGNWILLIEDNFHFVTSVLT